MVNALTTIAVVRVLTIELIMKNRYSEVIVWIDRGYTNLLNI